TEKFSGMLASDFNDWKISDSIKNRRSETQRHIRAAPEGPGLPGPGPKESISCPRPPGRPDGESPLLSPHGPAAPSGSLL
ncbi:hypothetical protein JOQ06_024628, partial [Pogonophryne albipinna]